MSARILWTTDWHLGYLTKKHPDPYVQIGDIRRILQFAVDHMITDVVVSGDISDTSELSSALSSAFLGVLLEFDGLVNTFLLAGNHDYCHDDLTALDFLARIAQLCKTVKVITRDVVEMEIGGVPTAFMPFPHVNQLQPQCWPDKYYLVFSHVEIAGGLRDNKTVAKNGLVLTGDDFVCNGHMHMKQSGPRWECVGPPWQVRFNDDPMRYIAVVNATADDYGVADVRVDYYQFEPTVKLVELYIESEADYQQLTLDQNTLFKLVVAPGVPVPTAYLRQFSNIVHLNTSGVSHAESTAGYVQANAVDLAVDTQTLLDEWLSAANLDDGVVRMAQAIHASLEQKLAPASARIAA